MGDEYENESFHTPLLHLLLHVNPLFLQQLPLSEGPVDRLCWCLSTWRPLSLQASLLRVIKTEHMAFPHDDTVSWKVHTTAHTSDETLLMLLLFSSFHCEKNQTRLPNVPDRRTMRPVTLFPLTYVSAPSHGSKTTHPVHDTFYKIKAICKCMKVNSLRCRKWKCFKLQWRPSPSPWGPVVLLKVQCSSLIKWPLRTMSWRVLAFSRPTLGRSRKINNSSCPYNGARHLIKRKGFKTYFVMPSLM